MFWVLPRIVALTFPIIPLVLLNDGVVVLLISFSKNPHDSIKFKADEKLEKGGNWTWTHILVEVEFDILTDNGVKLSEVLLYGNGGFCEFIALVSPIIFANQNLFIVG